MKYNAAIWFWRRELPLTSHLTVLNQKLFFLEAKRIILPINYCCRENRVSLCKVLRIVCVLQQELRKHSSCYSPIKQWFAAPLPLPTMSGSPGGKNSQVSRNSQQYSSNSTSFLLPPKEHQKAHE